MTNPAAVGVTLSGSKTASELNFRGRIRELDGLRALAVMLVLLVHFGPLREHGTLLWKFESVGWMGVDLFFVLSGFLISGVLLDARETPSYYRNFYIRRIYRIFPLYYTVLAIGSLSYLVWRIEPRHQFVHEAWWYFFYLGNFWPTFTPYLPTFLAPLWSLQIEEQFYLIFPFLVRNLKPNVLFRILVGVMVLSGPIRFAVYLWKPGFPMLEYVSFPLRSDGLAIGALLALRTRQGPWRIWPGRMTILMIAMLGALWAYLAWGGYDWFTGRITTFGYSVIAVAFASVVLWVLRFRETWLTAGLRAGPLQYLGKISYGIYILQVPAYLLVRRISNHFGWALFDRRSWHAMGWEGFGLVFTFAVLAASISWYILERPIMNAKDRWTIALRSRNTHEHGSNAALPRDLDAESLVP
jgi:peptidoglycan/LPS O-acetylase OafA/YrhL